MARPRLARGLAAGAAIIRSGTGWDWWCPGAG